MPPRPLYRLAAAVSLAAFSNTGVAATDEAKPEIGRVWNMFAQACNGSPGNGLINNTQEKAIQASGVVELDSLHLKFRVPQLPYPKKIFIKLYMGDKSRGVIDNYLLLAPDDLAAPVAAVVITELPKEFDANKALAAVQTLERGLASKLKTPPVLDSINGPYGQALEMLVPNRGATHCFPTAPFQQLPADWKISSLGISRFAFTQGYLVEFALVLQVDPAQSEGQRKAYARQVMDTFWSGLLPM